MFFVCKHATPSGKKRPCSFNCVSPTFYKPKSWLVGCGLRYDKQFVFLFTIVEFISITKEEEKSLLIQNQCESSTYYINH